MGLFSHHDKEPETAEFMGLVLNADALVTPVGDMPLGEIARAEFFRKIVHDGYGPDETSAPAVVGGAVVGGVVFGAAGAVVGGLAGSTVKEQGEEKLRSEAVQLIFETDTLNFTMDIPRDREGGAVAFAESVKHAMKRHAKVVARTRERFRSRPKRGEPHGRREPEHAQPASRTCTTRRPVAGMGAPHRFRIAGRRRRVARSVADTVRHPHRPCRMSWAHSKGMRWRSCRRSASPPRSSTTTAPPSAGAR